MDPVNLPQMLDITAPDFVEIRVRHDNSVIWVNVNGTCVLRCCHIKGLQISTAKKPRTKKVTPKQKV